VGVYGLNTCVSGKTPVAGSCGQSNEPRIQADY
jgi:hypothetical protein